MLEVHMYVMLTPPTVDYRLTITYIPLTYYPLC